MTKADRPTPLHEFAMRIKNVSIGSILLAAIISCTPWFVAFTVLQNATGRDLEDAYGLTSLLGILAFTLTGPVVGIGLSFPGRHQVTFWRFFGVFWLVALPILSFETLSYSSSAMSIFLPASLFAGAALKKLIAFSGLLAVGIYILFFIVLYQLSLRGPRSTVIGSVIIFGLTLITIVLRVYGK
jgi:hypothetical protein